MNTAPAGSQATRQLAAETAAAYPQKHHHSSIYRHGENPINHLVFRLPLHPTFTSKVRQRCSLSTQQATHWSVHCSTAPQSPQHRQSQPSRASRNMHKPSTSDPTAGRRRSRPRNQHKQVLRFALVLLFCTVQRMATGRHTAASLRCNEGPSSGLLQGCSAHVV